MVKKKKNLKNFNQFQKIENKTTFLGGSLSKTTACSQQGKNESDIAYDVFDTETFKTVTVNGPA